ncbi:MAG: class I SAM-dependent methyltransferase [Acidobacteriota bacterium]
MSGLADGAAPETAEERRSAFAQRSAEYLKKGHDRQAAARLVAEAAGDLTGPALDVGTGKGLLAMALARRGLEVVSVDINAEDSALARLLAEEAGLDRRIRFVLQDASTLPHPDGAFGCALMMDVLHHLADASPVLHEMARVVRPGGTIVVSDFTEEGFAVVAAIHRGEGREHGRSAVTVEAAAEILTAAGWCAGGEAYGHLHHVRWFVKV